VHQAVWRGKACVVKTVKRPPGAPNPGLAISDRIGSNEELGSLGGQIADGLLLKELRSMLGIRPHENVISLRGVCLEPLSIIMEYVEGGSLEGLLRRDCVEITGEMAVEFCYDIASGMRHLHAENVLHCDLSARNVLLALKHNRYECKIADFGLAHFVNESGIYNTDMALQMPIRWTAPEILMNSKTQTCFNDYWAYGVVVWEILERALPYSNYATQQEVIVAVLRGERLPKPTRILYPDVLDDIMKLCFRAKPSERPTFEEIQNMLLPEMIPRSHSKVQYPDYSSSASSEADANVDGYLPVNDRPKPSFIPLSVGYSDSDDSEVKIEVFL